MLEVVTYFSYVAIPAAIIFTATFLWNLWLAPYNAMKAKLNDMEGRLALIHDFANDKKVMNEEAMEQVQAKLNEAINQIDRKFATSSDLMIAQAQHEYRMAVQTQSRSEMLVSNRITSIEHSVQMLDGKILELQVRMDNLPQEIRVISSENVQPVMNALAALQREIATKG